jgi:hypothetical protein
LQSHFASLDARLMTSTAARFADERPRATFSFF